MKPELHTDGDRLYIVEGDVKVAVWRWQEHQWQILEPGFAIYPSGNGGFEVWFRRPSIH